MIKDSFKDILGHTHGLSFITDVKLTGEADKTRIEAIAENKTVVLMGETKEPIADLTDHVVGLHRMSVLSGYISGPMFDTDEAEISIVEQTRGDKTQPTEIKFDSKKGHKAFYRFMGEEAASQIEMPKFKGVEWNVAFQPTLENLKELSYFAGILGSYEPSFEVHMTDGNLEFHIGTGASDRTVLPIASGLEGNLNTAHHYPLAQVLSILKLSDSEQCVIQFSDVGCMQITLDSGLGIYDYILPARMR
jgi:hypothetical protein